MRVPFASHRVAVFAYLALPGVLASAPASELAAQDRSRVGDVPTEVPCTALRSALHGVVLIGARIATAGGPPCEVMLEYRDWLARSDTLFSGGASRNAGFTGREWDFASGAMRLGAPTFFVLIRGDSLTPAAPGRPRRLHLSAFAAEPREPLTSLGSWYVLLDEDSSATRIFRSSVTGRRLHAVLEDRGSIVYAIGGVKVDGVRVRAQLASARALRRALGFADPLPAARFVLGSPRDTTLAMLGVVGMDRPLFAMMVYPPLAVFSPLSALGGLDDHELVHVATFGRRDVIPGSVGEAFAMHHGGAHGRSFTEAFCASAVLRRLPPITVAELDSAFAGQWWNDPRADVTGFALGHAIGWFIEQRGDSAWIFADGASVTDNDAVGFLARRAGLARDEAMRAVAETFGQRRADCAPHALTPPSGAEGVPGRGSP